MIENSVSLNLRIEIILLVRAFIHMRSRFGVDRRDASELGRIEMAMSAAGGFGFDLGGVEFLEVPGLVGEKNAVQMIDFVLKDMGQESTRAAAALFSLLIVCLEGDTGRAVYLAIEPAHGKAAFAVEPFLFLGFLGDDGIDENLMWTARGFLQPVEYEAGDDEYAQGMSDLRSGQADSVILRFKGIDHLPDDLLDLWALDLIDRYGGGVLMEDWIVGLQDSLIAGRFFDGLWWGLGFFIHYIGQIWLMPTIMA
jgi:hypothetical protein